MPADFGPEIPDEGVDGVLRVADPEDACSPLTFSDFQTPWIALIARQQQLHPNNCTFDIKVWNAQAAGAIAAIVYDDVFESLIIMSKPKGHPDPYIPSVFVSQKAGIIMHKLMTLDTIRVRITPLSSVAWLSMLMSAFLGVLALGVVLATFYVMRSWSMWITGMHNRGTGAATGAAAGQGARAPGQVVPGGPADPAVYPGLTPDTLRSLPVLVFEPQAASARASRAPSAAPSAAGSLSASLAGSLTQAGMASATQQGRLAAAAAVGASVWAGEVGDEGEAEEMRPLLLGALAGDVEEGGCGGCRGHGEDDLDERASRSSSEVGTTAGPLGGMRPPGAHAGETKRMCAICLESYMEGEKIRVLPCAHRFHMGCVDQWLGSRRFCPVCKHDASQPLPQPPSTAAAGTGAAGGGGAPINGWSLLFSGLVDLLRRPTGTPRQVAGAAGGATAADTGGAPGGAQLQQLPHRSRSRRHRHQTSQQQRARRGSSELQEPLLGRTSAPQQQSPLPAAAAAAALAPAPAGPAEPLSGASTLRPAAAAAAIPPATITTGAAAPAGAEESAADGGASSSSTPAAAATSPIPIPAAPAPTVEAAAETGTLPPAAPTAAAADGSGANGAASGAAAAGGPAARVRQVLAGLLGGTTGRSAAAGAPQYSSTL